MKWYDIKKCYPPEDEDILLGHKEDGYYVGLVFYKKNTNIIRMIAIKDLVESEDVEIEKIIYWMPLPDQPERSKREDPSQGWDTAHKRYNQMCRDAVL